MTEKAQKAIDEFLDYFEANLDNYQKICAVAEQRLQERCRQMGIMAKINGRVKDAGRLREKLIKRHEEEGKNYQSVDDIHKDLGDLVGLRIALYFPSDADKVPRLLEPHFVTKRDPVKYPEAVSGVKKGFMANLRRTYPGYADRKFDGYGATHYRVHLASWPVQMEHPPFIEIQVASLLMHAWSEVEHDLAYKKRMGDVSPEEYACLDELNGLVMAGELALNRLNALSQQRIRNIDHFDTPYTLYAYLTEWMKDQNLGDRDPGNVQILFDAYAEQDCLSRDAVVGELNKISKFVKDETEPLADLLLRQFARQDRRKLVRKLMSDAISRGAYRDPDAISDSQVGNFLGKWNALEDKLRRALLRQGYRDSFLLRPVHLKQILGEEMFSVLNEVQMERNRIVHGYQLPDKAEFRQIMEDMERLRAWLEQEYGV